MYRNFLLLLALVTLCTLPARATIQVGDEATLTFPTVDGKTIDLAQLHGKIVIVDFWATWCGPCMQEAPHMVQINQKYADKGLQIIGISLDENRQAMIQVARQKGFTWPQYFDGLVWNNKIWKRWGTNGIPFTVLINPEGKVVWTGHPAGGLDQALEKTFKQDPPRLVDPSVLSAANSTLDDVEQKLKAGDTRSAIRLLAKVPAAAKSDADFASRAADVQKSLEKAGDAMLADVDPLIEKGDYVAAISKLKDVSSALTGTPAGIKARQKLSALSSKPEAQAALATAEKESRAAELLAAARKLQASKKDAQAYERYQELAKTFPDIEAGKTAAEAVKTYEREKPELVKKASESAASSRAKAALGMADSYRNSGRADLARAKYQSVMKDYPGTTYADTAKRALDEMEH